MVQPRNPNDQVTISPEVLLTIARFSTLEVPGVARMGEVPGGVNRLWRRTPSAQGVQIMIEDGLVTVDLFIVAYAHSNLRAVCRDVQQRAVRAVREIVGMNVSTVNVHVEDITFDEADGNNHA